MAVILFRHRRARRLSQSIARRDGVATIAFGGAQLRDVQDQVRGDFGDGCLAIDRGTLSVWTVRKSADGNPAFRVAIEDAIDVRSESVIGCYPLLVLVLADSHTLSIRPLKPTGLVWRIGMTRHEARAAVDDLAAMLPMNG